MEQMVKNYLYDKFEMHIEVVFFFLKDTENQINKK